MRLKSLEMVGFKSFASRTVVEFNPGITAVVGPNGCGKSNIVDALRWAMGEQSARHLRGHLMEDVIFNGSESLQPTGMAEVSLIFDNEDGRGPVEYNGFSEIMVTRRLFRSGESEYAINKVPCRLKDVIELFLGTGIGNKAYSIVEQGRVDELVNAKPEDRRSLIEEAAGTSKYKSRKLVAERKLERTQQNLLRVKDIVREVERQIRSMELQAKKAERYKILKKELKEKDLTWAAMQREELEQEIFGCETKLRATEDRFAELQTSLLSKESESEGIRLTLLEEEKAIGLRQEEVFRLKVQIQGREQRIDYDKKDCARLEETARGIQTELAQLEEKLAALSVEVEQLQNAKENFEQLSLFEQTRLRDKEQDLEKVKAEIQILESDLEREKASLIELLNEISYLRNELHAKEKRRTEIDREISKNQEETAAAEESLRLWTEKQRDRRRGLESAGERAATVAGELRAVTESYQKLSEEKESREGKLESLKEQQQEVRSRLSSLEDLHKNYEGFQEGVRAIMLRRQREAVSNGVYGLVAEIIEAPESFEKALTAVLGDRLQYIIVKGHEEGIEAIEYLKRESSGRGSFIPLELSRMERRPLPLTEPEVVAPLLGMVSVKDGYRNVAEYLLADVVIVRDLKSGLELWNRNGFVSTLVTPEGEVIDSMGVISGGSEHSLEGGLISQKRQMRDLQALLKELDARVQEEGAELGRLGEQLERTEARKTLLVQEGHRLELERVGLEHELLQVDQEMIRLRETLQTLAQENTDLSTTKQFLEEEIRECQIKIEVRLRDKVERDTLLAEKQQMLSQFQELAERLESEATESRIRGVTLGERKENTQANLQNRLRFQDEIRSQIAFRQSQVTQMLQRKDQLEETLLQAIKSVEEERQRLGEIERLLETDRQRYKAVSRQLLNIEETIKEMRPLGQAAQEEKNQLQLWLSEKRLNLQHLIENIREKYDVDLKEISPQGPRDDLSRESLLAEIDDLRGRLERMGEVNLAAIGEFEELNSRYQFMTQQREDLEKSMADLHSTIIKLNRICRLRFREAFEEISQRFQEIFPRLFRGGKARLVLTDDNDLLETGVDIVAQPPGKKLQSVTLLSGGEKALTAVSLLFAIFMTKPSPFCFLDEVDAPLDDANIDRFNELVKEMSQSSQFVLITHNKRTMQAAEILYGITMAEPGVSKVVSVKMS